MREKRRRKALYVNRREDLYAAALLKKERAPAAAKTIKGRAVRKRPASGPSTK